MVERQKRIIYWRVYKQKPASIIVEFWSKPDRSNTLILSVQNKKDIAQRITDITGLRHFELVEVA